MVTQSLTAFFILITIQSVLLLGVTLAVIQLTMLLAFMNKLYHILSTASLTTSASTPARSPKRKLSNYTKPDRVFPRTQPINQLSATGLLAIGVLTALTWARPLPATPQATPTPAGS